MLRNDYREHTFERNIVDSILPKYCLSFKISNFLSRTIFQLFLIASIAVSRNIPMKFSFDSPILKIEIITQHLRNCYKRQTYLYVFGWKMTSYILHFPPSNISSRGGVIEWGNVQLNPRFFSSRIHFASSTNSFVAKIWTFYSYRLSSIFGLNSENFAIFIF